MWLHFLLFFAILLIVAIQKSAAPYSDKRRILYCGIFLLFFIFLTFRAYTVGNDTPEYLRIFKLVNFQSSLTAATTVSRYEIGYVALNYLVGRFTNNFTVLLAIISAFYLISSLVLIKRFAKSDSLAIVLTFTLSLMYLAINIERQCIAMAIFYLAIPLLINKKRVLYCLLIVIASLFHSISIVLVALVFLPEINFGDKKNFRKWLLFSIVALVSLNFVVTRILVYFPYFQHYYIDSIYSEGGVRSASVAFFAVRLVIVVLIRLVGGFQYQREDNSQQVKVFDKLLFLDVMIAAASIGFNMFDRLENYFTLGFIIAVSNAVYSMTSVSSEVRYKNKKVVTVIIVGLTFAYITATIVLRPDWTGIFPYSFL